MRIANPADGCPPSPQPCRRVSFCTARLARRKQRPQPYLRSEGSARSAGVPVSGCRPTGPRFADRQAASRVIRMGPRLRGEDVLGDGRAKTKTAPIPTVVRAILVIAWTDGTTQSPSAGPPQAIAARTTSTTRSPFEGAPQGRGMSRNGRTKTTPASRDDTPRSAGALPNAIRKPPPPTLRASSPSKRGTALRGQGRCPPVGSPAPAGASRVKPNE